MAADIESFIESVVEESCILLQIQNPATNTTATTDPRVNICARSAYSQIASYLNRDLIFDYFKEYYYDQDTRIALRMQPIAAVVKLCLIDDTFAGMLTDSTVMTELVADVDYTIRNNKDLILNSGLLGLSAPISIYVEYEGGFYDPSENPRIYEAFLLQTVANYNRMPILGVSEMSTTSGKVTAGSNTGSLVDSARVVLDPYVYYGAAEPA
jgi:hypothetical protein